jgi:hypothetical protein
MIVGRVVEIVLGVNAEDTSFDEVTHPHPFEED